METVRRIRLIQLLKQLTDPDFQRGVFRICGHRSEDIAYANMNPQIEAMKALPHFDYTSDFSKGNFYFLVAPAPLTGGDT